MAIVIRFAPEGMTTAKYNEVISKLEESGAGSPQGRLYHVCFGDPNNLRVSDIWDSRESFDRFGASLRPVLEQVGIGTGQPEILEVRNIIEGTKAASTTP